MRHIFIISLFINFSFYSYAQYPWPPQGERGKDYQINSKDKSDGLHYRTYGKGEIYYAGIFNDGHPKSNTDFYYYFKEPNGQVMTIHHIQDNHSIILAENYHTNGKLMSTGKYINRKKEGLWKFYSDKGYLTDESMYVNDQINGTQHLFDNSGNVIRIFNYVNGKKDGEWKEFYKDGTKRVIGAYKNDNQHGKVIYYTSRGGFEITGGYHNGQMHGIWQKYNLHGEIEITTKYEYGKKLKERRVNGTFKDYWDNDIPKAQYIYEDGKKNGPFIEWFDMGTWTKVPMDVEGAEQGYDFKLVLQQTQIQREGDYLDGKLEGEVFYYNENGRLIKTETYVNGILESVVER